MVLMKTAEHLLIALVDLLNNGALGGSRLRIYRIMHTVVSIQQVLDLILLVHTRRMTLLVKDLLESLDEPPVDTGV